MSDAAMGIWLAHQLGRPLMVAEKPVYISAELADAVHPTTPAELAVESVGDIELARRCAFILTMAEREISAMGISAGVLPPPSPPEPVLLPGGVDRPAATPRKPLRFDVTTQRDGSLKIITEYHGEFEVRTSNNQAWFIITADSRYELRSWHPSQQAAVDWLREMPAREWRDAPFNIQPEET